MPGASGKQVSEQTTVPAFKGITVYSWRRREDLEARSLDWIRKKMVSTEDISR